MNFNTPPAHKYSSFQNWTCEKKSFFFCFFLIDPSIEIVLNQNQNF